MSKRLFKLQSKFTPAGDQPEAIKELAEGLKNGLNYQTLLGATGTGKTFTIANVIEKLQKPTLVIAHNKTLAAQLAQEYRDFFPDNAVHYFVSYYDFYQPEAYMPVTDTYIEKEAMINEEIDRLRHASTQALLTRDDVIIVASVSCIYGLGNPENYQESYLDLSVDQKLGRRDLLERLVLIHFKRTNSDLTPGSFRAVGGAIEIMPTNEKIVYRIEVAGEKIKELLAIDPISRTIKKHLKSVLVFPTKHFITAEAEQKRAITSIKMELKKQLAKLEKQGRPLEAERLKRRTNYDLALIKEVGYCNGIENYSRHFDGREPGEPPFTLLDYFSHKRGLDGFLTVIDESHVTVPQLSGMYAGDAARKKVLIEHGFRLPSARDNRPLNFEEFKEKTGQIIFTSATPAEFERQNSKQTVEQIIRPTGLIDPEIFIKPINQKEGYPGQIQDLISEGEKVVKGGGRVIATALTKKMAEDLSDFLKEKGIKAEYIHSDIKTLDRIEILTNFRKGTFDFLVGVNLLREGLDLPEVELIGILDADKEGFLRSETSLIQIIGRAARNVRGRVTLYADNMTDSMNRAIEETNRRREIQLDYNKKHNITPKTIVKNIKDITEEIRTRQQKTANSLLELDKEIHKGGLKKLLKEKEKQMNEAVKALDFETAAIIRDELLALKK